MITRGALLAAVAARLAAGGVEEPRREARLLLRAALLLTDTDLLLRAEAPVEERDALRLTALAERRATGEPLARLTGRKEFWSLDFTLSPDTLVPRPDTETLVEAALQALPDRAAPLRLLDLGTGTGALLAALLSEYPAATGLGIDRSEGAARQALANLAALGLCPRGQVMVGDWAEALAGRFDLIVSNPPYIETAAIDTLDVDVRSHDPYLALDGGADGLVAYRAIAAALPRLLTQGGYAVLELGAGQETDVAALLRAAGLDVAGPARRDLGGIPRALVARRA